MIKPQGKKKKNNASYEMSADKAMEIMLDHGFLPQLPSVSVPALIINVQNSSSSHFQGINFQEAKKTFFYIFGLRGVAHVSVSYRILQYLWAHRM